MVSVARRPSGGREQTELQDSSLSELVRQLADETTTLVRQELELVRVEATRAGEAVVTLAKQELQLAKAEMSERGQGGPALGMLGVAGGLRCWGRRADGVPHPRARRGDGAVAGRAARRGRLRRDCWGSLPDRQEADAE